MRNWPIAVLRQNRSALSFLLLGLLVGCRSIPNEEELVSLASANGRYGAVILSYDKTTRVARTRREVISASRPLYSELPISMSHRSTNGKVRSTVNTGRIHVDDGPNFSQTPEYEFGIEHFYFDGTHWRPYTPPFKK